MAITLKKKDAVEKVQVEVMTSSKEPGKPPVKVTEVLADKTINVPVDGIEHVPADKLANVGMTAGFTHALPNYSNCKATVSLFMPCHVDDVDTTFSMVSEWVTAKLGEVHTEYTSDEGGN